MNTDLLVAVFGILFLAAVGITYGLYDERKSKRKADAAAREKP